MVWVLTAAGLIAYFVTVGLDQADKLASSIGLPVTLLGLAGQVFSLIMAHRTTAPPAPGSEYVGGSQVSVRRVRGRSRVTLRRLGRNRRTVPAPPTPGSRIEGNHVQIDGAGESVVEER